VNVNPELRAKIDGKRHVVKLYLKAVPLSKQKANVALHLLERYTLPRTTPGVLDVRRSKLYVPTIPVEGMDALLRTEAAAFTALWNSV
jgi:hypothetical protein